MSGIKIYDLINTADGRTAFRETRPTLSQAEIELGKKRHLEMMQQRQERNAEIRQDFETSIGKVAEALNMSQAEFESRAATEMAATFGMTTDEVIQVLQETKLLAPHLFGMNETSRMIVEDRLKALAKNPQLCLKTKAALNEVRWWIPHMIGWAYPSLAILDGRRVLLPSDVKRRVAANPNMCRVQHSPLSASVPIRIPK